MSDHRRTPSQRAYRLPGWFFILTATLGLIGFAVAGWLLIAHPSATGPVAQSPHASASPSTQPAPTATRSIRPSRTPTSSAAPDDERSGVTVQILNASHEAGLAKAVAETAKKSGWKVADIGNWIYGAAVNAVYYPVGHQEQAELLADDLDIASVRPARPGMSADDLTVLLVSTP